MSAFKDQQHHYACLDPECPVVVFVDRVWLTTVVEAGVCPNDDCKGPYAVLDKTF